MRAGTAMAWRRSLPWLALGLLATGILATRLQLSFDLSAFFPRQTAPMQDVLLEQFRSGPGSRLLVVGLSGLPRERLAELSDELRAALAESAAFGSVMNGSVDDDLQSLPEPVASQYLLMRDIDYDQAALNRTVAARLQDLAFGGGSMLDLIARDPGLVSIEILQALAPVDLSGELWFAEGGSAVLIAETRASAVDIAGQAEAVALIRSAFAALDAGENAQLDITGVGAFSVELQQTIRAEATLRSILASVAILAILTLFYRRPRLLLLATMPIGMGFLVGLAAVSLCFETIHGITLAFGFTLLGVAIDYPLHLFSHQRDADGSIAMEQIWPTIRLGAGSTAIAYLALALSGSQGLAQIGLFTTSGVLVAVLVTRYWLPYLLPNRGGQPPPMAPAAKPAVLRMVPAAAVFLLASLAVYSVAQDGLWDDQLTTLSPVPQDRLLVDRDLRAATGAPDMRYQVVLFDQDLQSLLQRNERLDRVLQDATDGGLLSSWQSVTQVFPSHEVQEARRAAIPPRDVLQERLASALRETPFRDDAFAAFSERAELTRTGRLLETADFDGSPLANWLDAHLLKIGDQWVSLVSLTEPVLPAFETLIREDSTGAAWLDMRAQSNQLMRDYRGGAVSMLSFAAIAIVLLLWYQRRNVLQISWIILTVAAALLATVALVTTLHGPLTVIHLVALLLVMGLGLDYALFLSRAEAVEQRSSSQHAVLACAASTTVAFAILAGSSIPMLRFLGLTVASGSALSYALAFAGSRARWFEAG